MYVPDRKTGRCVRNGTVNIVKVDWPAHRTGLTSCGTWCVGH